MMQVLCIVQRVVEMVKAHRILGKSEIMQMDYMNFILEAAASSARFGTITEWQPSGRFVTRANINALLVSVFGTGKTSSFIKMEGAVAANDISFPGMIGTITKDGEFNPGLVVKAAGKLLIIDEFQKMDDTTKNAMNSILEYPHTYSRNLGFAAKRPFNLNRKGCVVKVKEGWIQAYSKFSCISGGMYLNRDNQVQQAWASRFIPIVFKPSMAYFERMTAGEQQIRINPHCFEADFQFRDYMTFHKEYWENLKKMPTIWNWFEEHADERGYSGRILQDIARLSCFIASLEKRSIIRPDDWKQALKLQKMVIINTICSSLTEIELKILECPERENKEISGLLSVSEVGVWKARKRLKSLGLLEGGVALDSEFKIDSIN
jgi:hypothetical protein